MKATKIRLPSIALASIAFLAPACSSIDGLPEQAVQPSDSGFSSVDAALGSDAEVIADAGGADAGVDAGEAVDASVFDAADATVTVDATPDATVDAAPCVAEDDVTFCTRLGKNCGTVVADDNCGTRRTVASCGVCGSYYDSCGGGGVPNRCGCTPESDWSFCTRLGRTCGAATGTDNCGLSRAVGSCGGVCPPDAGPVDAGPTDGGVPDASTVQRWTFTNCGATGATGPTQAQCDAEYAGTNLAGAIALDAGFQSWRVPSQGRYRIEAFGAGALGRGARISSEFSFANDESISVVVGHQGSSAESGPGGGGTFVFRGNDVLLAAGGAGGGGGEPFRSYPLSCGYCMVDGIASSSAAAAGCAGFYYTGGRNECSISEVPRASSSLDVVLLSVDFRQSINAVPAYSGYGAFGTFGRGTPGEPARPASYPAPAVAGSGGGGGGFQVGGRGYGGAHGGGGSSFSAGSNTFHFGGSRIGNGALTVERLP